MTRVTLPAKPRIGDVFRQDGRWVPVAALWPGVVVLDDGTRIAWQLETREGQQ